MPNLRVEPTADNQNRRKSISPNKRAYLSVPPSGSFPVISQADPRKFTIRFPFVLLAILGCLILAVLLPPLLVVHLSALSGATSLSRDVQREQLRNAHDVLYEQFDNVAQSSNGYKHQALRSEWEDVFELGEGVMDIQRWSDHLAFAAAQQRFVGVDGTFTMGGCLYQVPNGTCAVMEYDGLGKIAFKLHSGKNWFWDEYGVNEQTFERSYRFSFPYQVGIPAIRYNPTAQNPFWTLPPQAANLWTTVTSSGVPLAYPYVYYWEPFVKNGNEYVVNSWIGGDSMQRIIQNTQGEADSLVLFVIDPSNNLMATTHGKAWNFSTPTDFCCLLPVAEPEDATEKEKQLLKITDVKVKDTYALLKPLLTATADEVEATGKVDGKKYIAAAKSFHLNGVTLWIMSSQPEKIIVASANKAIQRGTIIIAVVVPLSLIIVFLVGFYLAAKPLTRYTDITRDLALLKDVGDHSVPLSMTTELTSLGTSIRKLERGIGAFARYLPVSVVSEVMGGGLPATVHLESKELVIMFTDIEGFTTLTEKLSPSDLVELLTRFFTRVTTVLATHQATVDKFIGDCVMAFWGAPHPIENAETLAIKASVACWEDFVASNAEETVPILTRSGIASGTVMVGNIGSDNRISYTTVGDMVNMASRLEGANKAFGSRIMCSDQVYRHAELDNTMRAREIGPVCVVGKESGVVTYEIIPNSEWTTVKERIVSLYSSSLEKFKRQEFGACMKELKSQNNLLQDDLSLQLLYNNCEMYLKGSLCADPPVIVLLEK